MLIQKVKVMAKVLIIDPDDSFSDILSNMVEAQGHDVVCVHSMKDGLKRSRTSKIDVVFLDSRLPDGDYFDALEKFTTQSGAPEVVVMADTLVPEEAEKAIRGGAWDYCEKGASKETLILPLVHALNYRSKRTFEADEGEKAEQVEAFKSIIGESQKIRSCVDLAIEAAGSDVNVLISGETGTGKEIFAWAIHQKCARSRRNFVVVDCAALPESLVESTLFGHEKGAFTGADRAEDGLVKQADGGTLFLDEVGELPLPIQRRFLRVLDMSRFRRVGGNKEIESNFRLIAATNRDLDRMAEEGEFRKDLLFRLRAFSIHLPPLREHPEDLQALATHYLKKICRGYGIVAKGFASGFFEVLWMYDWPGNVRELIHALDRAITSAMNEPVLFPTHLPTYVHALSKLAVTSRRGSPRGRSDTASSLPRLQDIRDAAIAEVEEKYLTHLMLLTKGDMKEAVRISGLSQSRLYALLKKYQQPVSG